MADDVLFLSDPDEEDSTSAPFVGWESIPSLRVYSRQEMMEWDNTLETGTAIADPCAALRNLFKGANTTLSYAKLRKTPNKGTPTRIGRTARTAVGIGSLSFAKKPRDQPRDQPSTGQSASYRRQIKNSTDDEEEVPEWFTAEFDPDEEFDFGASNATIESSREKPKARKSDRGNDSSMPEWALEDFDTDVPFDFEKTHDMAEQKAKEANDTHPAAEANNGRPAQSRLANLFAAASDDSNTTSDSSPTQPEKKSEHLQSLFQRAEQRSQLLQPPPGLVANEGAGGRPAPAAAAPQPQSAQTGNQGQQHLASLFANLGRSAEPTAAPPSVQTTASGASTSKENAESAPSASKQVDHTATTAAPPTSLSKKPKQKVSAPVSMAFMPTSVIRKMNQNQVKAVLESEKREHSAKKATSEQQQQQQLQQQQPQHRHVATVQQGQRGAESKSPSTTSMQTIGAPPGQRTMPISLSSLGIGPSISAPSATASSQPAVTVSQPGNSQAQGPPPNQPVPMEGMLLMQQFFRLQQQQQQQQQHHQQQFQGMNQARMSPSAAPGQGGPGSPVPPTNIRPPMMRPGMPMRPFPPGTYVGPRGPYMMPQRPPFRPGMMPYGPRGYGAAVPHGAGSPQGYPQQQQQQQQQHITMRQQHPMKQQQQQAAPPPLSSQQWPTLGQNPGTSK